ncbi:MAG: hypothetical protein OEO19_03550 [Gammaproteobacteria bacterium]|nr:hypothetical protein [Gammaproteobacteria bacterium]MDH3449804.1 hypothetical protein [Gammaproteobacteria bacterium]
MSNDDDIPTLTDLIESEQHITLSDLGLDDDPVISADNPAGTDIEIDATEVELVVDPFVDNPELEHTVRQILDKHLELAWQEIKLAIRRDLNKP